MAYLPKHSVESNTPVGGLFNCKVNISTPIGGLYVNNYRAYTTKGKKQWTVTKQK